MIRTLHAARFVTGLAVLCAATSVHAQKQPAGPEKGVRPVNEKGSESAGKCPVTGVLQSLTSFAGMASVPDPHGAAATETRINYDWWPNQLNLKVLHQNSPRGNPMGGSFNYAEEFKSLDLEAVRKDIKQLMTTSQDLSLIHI